MITNERVVSYIHSLEKSNGCVLDEIEKEAHKKDVPIIRKEMESYLKTMLAIMKPKRILELGTAVGYSAILMAKATDENCHITTIENYEKRIPIALENIKKANCEDRITLLQGDAYEILKDIDEPYEFVFIDAAKGQYMSYFEEVKRFLPKGGVVIADNVLQEGELVESRFVVERRNRTIHARLRDFLYSVKNMEEFESSIIPIGDGILLSVKK